MPLPLWLWEVVCNFESSAAKDCRACQRSKKARSRLTHSQAERHSRSRFLRTTRALMNGILHTEKAGEIAARQDERERAVEGRAADGQQDGRTEETAAAAAMIQVLRLVITANHIGLTILFLLAELSWIQRKAATERHRSFTLHEMARSYSRVAVPQCHSTEPARRPLQHYHEPRTSKLEAHWRNSCKGWTR